MTIIPTASLASIVTQHPELARELERRDLDYCCGGARTLDEACRAKGIDAIEVVAELAAVAEAGGPAPWATMGPDELVAHIETTHHGYLHAELPRLAALAEKVLAAHGARHPELVGVRDVYASLRADLEPHLATEEQVVFPMIRRLVGVEGSEPVAARRPVGPPISALVAEHDRAGVLLEQLRDGTRGFELPADGCASYAALYAGLAELEADTHLHVHKENNLLFPAVVALEAG